MSSSTLKHYSQPVRKVNVLYPHNLKQILFASLRTGNVTLQKKTEDHFKVSKSQGLSVQIQNVYFKFFFTSTNC